MAFGIFKLQRVLFYFVSSVMGFITIYLLVTINSFDRLTAVLKRENTKQTRSQSFFGKPVDSSSLPLRGPGDSMLPFQDKVAAQIKDPPKDIFVEKPVGDFFLDPKNRKIKKILAWNDMVVQDGRAKHYDFGYDREPFILAKCPVNTCFITSDRKAFKPEEVDALIWHFRSLDRSLPKVRSLHTRWVFFVIETPMYLFGNLRPFDGLFNWTYTYKHDSDFTYPFDAMYRRQDPLPEVDYRNSTVGKTKMAAWFVTNCNARSNRDRFVKSLQKYIKVDVYGRCGPLKCKCEGECALKQPTYCYEMLERDYKFYMALENSLCKDYVTEKLFNALRYNVVPVVYSLANFSDIAPPNSFINALEFASVKELAEYLLKLDKDDEAYLKYFTWKRYHQFSSKWVRAASVWCDLCERLHTDNSTSIAPLMKWYIEDSHCKSSFEAGRDFLAQQKALSG
ncbi:alpha-(1,3)-fucosyltransferase C-like [Palaemon carinicauda]|uniref:alpha-(1,3)-fucosyltransferase C-like n=1 Tax=Palaemon carinicauda TaxID=392227 RepID=UPI0035B62872